MRRDDSQDDASTLAERDGPPDLRSGDRSPPPGTPASLPYPWAVRALAWLLGAVLLFSAAAKLASLGSFEAYIASQHPLPSRMAAALAARAVIAVEAFLGLSCFVRAGFRRVALPGISLMLLAFSAFLAREVLAGRRESCHCFGELLRMSPAASLVKNLGLAAVVALLARGTRGWAAGSWRVPALLAAVATLTVFLAFPVRPAALASPGPFPFAGLGRPADGPGSGLATGTWLVAFLSLECEECEALASQLGQASGEGGLPPAFAVCLGDTGSPSAFFGRAGSQIPHVVVGPEVFFRFVGEKPPRLYLLKDGKTLGTWDGDRLSPGEILSVLRRQAAP